MRSTGSLSIRRARILTLLPLFLVSVAARAGTVPLVADSYTSGANPTINFGGLVNLNVGNAAANNIALVKFDLSSITSGVSHATLRVFVNKVGTPGAIDVLAVTSPWAETTVTGQFPVTLGSILATAIPVTTANTYIDIDVTLMVQNQVSLSQFYPNNGFAIVANASAPSTAIFLDSKENTATSHPATLEITLAGTTGAQGPTGPTGQTGASGPQGLQGLQGLAGTPGAPGAMGPQGLQGTPGSQGPAGTPGAGLVWRGAWNASPGFIYSAADAVSFNGSGYVALASNSGAQPDINPQDWSLLANAGSPGAAGAAGPQGSPGLQGTQGLQGAPGIQGQPGLQGAQGPAGAMGAAGLMGLQGSPGTVAGLNWRGVWNPNPAVLYNANDAVNFNGSSYVALSGNSGQQPDLNTQSWSLLASVGATGAVGAVGLTWRGTWSASATYNANDAVAFSGTSYLCVFGPNTNAEPDLPAFAGVWSTLASKGTAGTTGSQGVVGPQGASGPQGLTGVQGPTGPQGPVGPSHAYFLTNPPAPACIPATLGVLDCLLNTFCPDYQNCYFGGLNLPGGNYAIALNLNISTPVVQEVSCIMSTTTRLFSVQAPLDAGLIDLAGTTGTIHLQSTLATSGDAVLAGCFGNANDGSYYSVGWTILATQVGGIN